LLRNNGLSVKPSELDHYLWLVGQWLSWVPKKEGRGEVVDLFKKAEDNAVLRREVDILIGDLRDAK
ncbi:MAG: hypothetical protein QGD94_09340, partial [Planctomycetia bacterium]|nr:hypothetical protein [Planctomycetia bacterium]